MKVSSFITLTKVNDGNNGAPGAPGKPGQNYWVTNQWLDVSNTAIYKEDTWYPVVGTALARFGTCRTKVSVQLNSGTKPSWSTHSTGGFSCELDIQDQASGWGTTLAECLIFIDNHYWAGNESPVSYTQLMKPSYPVLYLRGGGKYQVSTDYPVTWSIKSDSYTWISGQHSESAPISKTRPKPKGKSIQGEPGKDSNQVVLQVANNSIAKFVQPWTNASSTISKQVCKITASSYLPANQLTWKCSHGTLTMLPNEPYSRTLAFSSIPLEARQKEQQVIVSVSTSDDHYSNLPIIIEQEKMPAGIYCGVVNSMPPTINKERPEGVFAVGDYVYYVGTTSGQSSNYITQNIYAYAGNGWNVANDPTHSFPALHDILNNSNADTPSLTILKEIVSNNVVTDNLVVNLAKVKGALDVNKINTKDEQGNGFELDTRGIRAKSSNGSTSWELRNDGSAILKNATIEGLMAAKSIENGALTTFEQVTGGNITIPQNLKSMYKASDLIDAVFAKLPIDSLRQGMENISSWNVTFANKKVIKLGFCDKSATCPNVNNNSDTGPLKFGKYNSSVAVNAGGTYTTFAGRYNRTGKPLYIKASTSLGGGMNEAFLHIANTGFDVTFTNAGFWLLPGYGLYGQARSWAWWGSQPCSTYVDVYYSNATCPSNWQLVNSKDSGIGEYLDTGYVPFSSVMASVTIPQDINYLWFHGVVYNVLSNNNSFNIYLYDGGTRINPISRPHENSIWFDVSRHKGKTLKLQIEGEMYEDTQSQDPAPTPEYNYNFQYAYIMFYTSNQTSSSHNGLEIITSDNNSYTISTNTNTGIYDNNQANFNDVTHGVNTSNFLSYIPNKKVIDLLRGVGINKDLKFSLSGALSYLTIDGVRYPSDTSKGLTELKVYEDFYRFFFNNNKEFIDFHFKKTIPLYESQKDINYSSNISGYLQVVASDEHITTATILPKNNNIYDIGKIGTSYKDLFIGNTLLAEKGYSKLPNGLLMQWGRVDGTSHGIHQINFPMPFGASPFFVDVICAWTDTSAKSHSSFVKNDSVSNTGFAAYTLGSTNANTRAFWIAIGR